MKPAYAVAFPARHTARWHRLLADQLIAREFVAYRSGHWPFADDPNAVAEVVLPFLRRQAKIKLNIGALRVRPGVTLSVPCGVQKSSAFIFEPRVASARAAGCDDYVAEPYSPRHLLAKIRQYLQ